MLRCSYVISSIIGFVYMTISSQSTFYTVGPDNVELMCVDSYVELRGLSDIECAIFTSQDISHNYAFTVRGGRCYVCRITDSLRLHNGEELSLKGPHLIAECKEGWFELRPYGCYTLKGEKKTWDQWKQECDKEDAVLATFETETEYNALEQYMESNKAPLGLTSAATNDFWLGASDRQEEGVYIWYATGQAIVFDDWQRSDNQPNDAYGGQDCMRYGFTVRAWYDDPCNGLHGAICEKK